MIKKFIIKIIVEYMRTVDFRYELRCALEKNKEYEKDKLWSKRFYKLKKGDFLKFNNKIFEVEEFHYQLLKISKNEGVLLGNEEALTVKYDLKIFNDSENISLVVDYDRPENMEIIDDIRE